ncbi:MAG TPA: hypothetical protein GXX75_13100 [Clostridiales bacterium]|nr:hypothetical protein [Clostridiales bacterium]
MLPGVFLAKKKNGTTYYRASITYRGKHISLGSYPEEGLAHQAYLLAADILSGSSASSPGDVSSANFLHGGISYGDHLSKDYPHGCILPFDKWIVLVNFRDNKIYFKNPIYIKKRYFLYYVDQDTCYRFDADDLFFYASHKIIKRGGHLFVSYYGMQVNILSRYGIKNYGVAGKDYIFVNGDDHDFSYHNIKVINQYHGVTKIQNRGETMYLAKIHINGDYLVGKYPSEEEAAIAYNKAALLLKNHGMDKNYPQNFIDGMDEIAYASIFQRLRISKKLNAYVERLQKG